MDKAFEAMRILAENKWGLTYCEETGEYMVDSEHLEFDDVWKAANADPAEAVLAMAELVKRKPAKAG